MRHREQRRRRRQGMTLVEIMIVVVIMAMLAAGIGFSAMHAAKQAQIDSTKSEVKALANVAEAYLLRESDGACPTMENLQGSGLMKRGSNTQDPWGGSYAISCEGGDVNVLSAGPDRESGTEDDLSVF